LKSSEKTFRLRAAKHQKVEEALIHWMKQIREKKISLSSDLILQKARHFAQMLNIDDFEPTLGYLRGLKRRNGIIFSKKHGESDSVNEEMVKKWFEELSNIIKDYKPEEVYNLDEMALFWRLLPSKTYCFTDESPYGSRKSKDRITVVVICNADGSERTCAMIGKSVKPSAFRGIKYFPIDYYQQRNAWINGSIYEKILKKLNQKMRSLNKNILLFVDNCRTHLYDIQLSNIEFNTFDDFISVDDNELVEITDDLSDEQIVNLVLNDKNEETVDLSDDESSETTVIQTISNSQALNAVNVLQHFFNQIGVNDVDQQLAEIQKKITENTFKSLKQTKITDYFA